MKNKYYKCPNDDVSYIRRNLPLNRVPFELTVLNHTSSNILNNRQNAGSRKGAFLSRIGWSFEEWLSLHMFTPFFGRTVPGFETGQKHGAFLPSNGS
jgi:hypothetical protein